MALTSNQPVLMFATYNSNPIDTVQTVPLYNINSHNSTIESDTRYWGANSSPAIMPPTQRPLPQEKPTQFTNPVDSNNPVALNYIGKENVRTIVVSTPYGNYSLYCNNSQILYVTGGVEVAASNITVGTMVGTLFYNGYSSYCNQVISNTVNNFSLVNMYNIQYSTSVPLEKQWLYVNNIMVK